MSLEKSENLNHVIMEVSLNNICRVCLSKITPRSKMTLLYNSIEPSNIPYMITACAAVQIFEDDGLPQQICHKCSIKLNIAFEFKQECEESDSKLRQYLNQSSENVIIEETIVDSEYSVFHDNEEAEVDKSGLLIKNEPQDNNLNIQLVIANSEIPPGHEEMKRHIEHQANLLRAHLTVENTNSFNSELTSNRLDLKQVCSTENSEENRIKKLTKRSKRFKKCEGSSNIKEVVHMVDDGRGGVKEKIIRVHQCETCGKTFQRREYLTQHIRIHTGEKPYHCHLCEKRFINSGHLTTHMRTHTGVKPHKCSRCPKAFSTRQELNKHIMVHNGERPFVCKLCAKRFGSSSNLYSHLKHHTGEKNFTCEHCGKAFFTKQELKQHLVVHTGEKAFLCEFCNKRFSQIAHLKRHSKLHK